jgi:hypothetical protein
MRKNTPNQRTPARHNTPNRKKWNPTLLDFGIDSMAGENREVGVLAQAQKMRREPRENSAAIARG